MTLLAHSNLFNRISRRIRIYSRNCFSLCIRGPNGFFWSKKNEVENLSDLNYCEKLEYEYCIWMPNINLRYILKRHFLFWCISWNLAWKFPQKSNKYLHHFSEQIKFGWNEKFYKDFKTIKKLEKVHPEELSAKSFGKKVVKHY